MYITGKKIENTKGVPAMNKNYMVKLVLVMITEEDGTETFYFDFFSDQDINNLSAYNNKVMSFLDVPVVVASNVKKSFEELYVSYRKKGDSVLKNKVAYNFSIAERYNKVNNWIIYYRKFSKNFLPA